ncbi:MAG: ATP-binding protein [Armatimonadota bacterium]|nr:ATP-binding protein [Armatimonadota bacterium]MDW8144112.1 ATP-binding protein [Armatimonadota bacterium]
MRRVLVQPVTYDEAKLRETQPYRATVAFLREVVKVSCMAVLEGEPGTGKTFGAYSFAQKRSIPFITAVEKVVMEKAPSRFFRSIAAEITGRQPVSLWDALEMMEQWASVNGTQRAIFIDEAQWLTGKALDTFRRLHDTTGVTILLIGHENELSRMLNRYPQARDRVAMRFVVPQLSMDDYRLLHGNDFNEELLHSIYELTEGNFRRLHRVVSLLFPYARARGKATQELTVSDLQVVSRYLVLQW